eukprot:5447509-Pyramimonas_sp.AAC.1
MAGMPKGDIDVLSQVLQVKPSHIVAMDIGLVRRPQLCWLSWMLHARLGGVDIVVGDCYFKVELHVNPGLCPVWAMEGWGGG